MPMNRNTLQDMVETYGNNNYDNIDWIVTDNAGDIIRLKWYRKPGRGVQWVDVDLGDGAYRTGVELYGPISQSAEDSLEENGAKVIAFIEVGSIERIAFKADTPPAWAWNNVNLATLTVNSSSVSGFNKNTLNYTVSLPEGTDSVPTVAATTENEDATVQITQSTSPNGTAKIVVTSEDGKITKTYMIEFNVDIGTDADLSSLKYDGNSVSNFDPDTLDYAVSLPFGTTDAPVITAVANDEFASVNITQPVSADGGSATIVVTANDGVTTKTYNISFTVSPS